MKKHLIAAAVATAFAAPAIAQVTVYGIFDTAYVSKSKIAAAGSGTDTRGRANDPTATLNRSTLDSGHWATSRLGFKGSEDLGGGMKAEFNLEGSLGTDEGTVANLGNRLAFVGVSGGFGTLRFGKVAADINTATTGQGVGNFANLVSGTSTRPQNAIDYVTPSFNGISLRVTHSPSATTESNKETSKSDGKYTSVGVSGKVGGLSFLVVKSEQKAQSAVTAGKFINANATLDGTPLSTTALTLDATASATVAARVATLTLPVDAQNGETQDVALLASYDFGMVRVSGQYLATKTEGTVNNAKGVNTVIDRKRYALTAIAPMGNASPFVNFRSYEDKTGTDKDATGMSVGVDYSLSKRTAAYVVYSKYSNESSSKEAGALMTTINDSDPKAVAIGIRHTF